MEIHFKTTLRNSITLRKTSWIRWSFTVHSHFLSDYRINIHFTEESYWLQYNKYICQIPIVAQHWIACICISEQINVQIIQNSTNIQRWCLEVIWKWTSLFPFRSLSLSLVFFLKSFIRLHFITDKNEILDWTIYILYST
jgi:hypothetical protein